MNRRLARYALPLLLGAGLLLAVAGALRPAGTSPGELALAQALANTPSTRVRYPANGLPVITLPDGETRQVRSLLDIKAPMKFGDFAWDEADVPKGPVWVRVDLKRQLLSVFRAGEEIGTAVILYGTDGHPTPTGAFHVLERKRDYWSRSYDAPMPFMLRLTADGVALHASDVQQGRATHGCIGLPPAFAAKLFDRVARGDLVVIS
jgi:hypothetical protein